MHSQPEVLHARLVDQLRAEHHVRTPGVEAALRAVPRHLFLPEVPIQNCYVNEQVVTKRDAEGTALSSASQPGIVAMMLEQLEVAPDHRVLEIGAGTGYNALLRTLAGTAGQVTTIDIDPDVAEEARARLAATGFTDVRVVTGDGAVGYITRAPFDRIIVTAGAWDLPPAWSQQVAAGGRLVVPLRWRGLTRSVAFHHHDGTFISRSMKMCGFIPMRGPGDGERTLHLAEDVTIHYDNDQPINADALRASWSSHEASPGQG